MNPESPDWVDPNPPRKAGDILGDVLKQLCPPADKPQPPRAEVKCGKCHQTFTSSAYWWGSYWKYANICFQCSSDYSYKEHLKSDPKPRTVSDDPLGVKQFYCPKCGIGNGVRPNKQGMHWVYEGICSHCGTTWVNLYHAYRRPPKEQQAQDSENPLDD